MAENPSLYRAIHHLRKNGLHAALGVDADKPIGKGKIDAASRSENKHVAAMARFAKTLGSLHKK